jgi:hypothetical protein
MHNTRLFPPAFSIFSFVTRRVTSGAVLSCVIAGTIAIGTASAQGTAGATIDETKLKNRTTPVHCVGNEGVELEGVLLKLDRVAVQAMGNCKVKIINSRIVGKVAVMAAGNAEVAIENSIIDGGLQLAGNSVTSFKSSTVRGSVNKLQTASVKDLGQNRWK